MSAKKSVVKATKNVAKELSETDKALLTQCESSIQKAQECFVDVCVAVLTIINKGLFRPQYNRSSTYFQQRWDMSAAMVTRYKKSAKLVEDLKNARCKKLPTNEGQCRELLAVDGDPIAVWKKVVASGKPITASLVKEIAGPLPKVEAKPCKVTIEINESDPDSLEEYYGVKVEQVSEDVCRVMIEAKSKAAVFLKLAKFSKLESITKVMIAF